MSAVLPKPIATPTLAPWFVAMAGFLALYLPSYWVAANGIWQTDDFGHEPIILVICLWLFWQVRERVHLAPDRPRPAWGWALLVAGLLLYAFGRVFTISSAEFLSQPLVVAAVLMLLKGPAALRAAWFAVLYLVFMAPLPESLVEAVTGPLKQWISYIVVNLLYGIGYPIARTGVTITIGPYQLLVADACSGLHSMFSLSALGTLFMYIMGRPSRWHNAVMLATIVPIAFGANIVRVLVLVLLTFHFGDDAGQGFLHGAAGVVLMLVALASFFLLDATLVALQRNSSGSTA